MTYIKSPLNYNGNKYKLLPQIIERFPKKINTFVDLFGGSGVISLNVEAEHIIYNDIVSYISNILDGIKRVSDIDKFLEESIYKTISDYSLSKTNKESFEKFRKHFNENMDFKTWQNLYILMCFSFNNQFRFNSKHEYNSSFGKHKSCYSNVTENKLRLAKKKLDIIDISFISTSFEKFDFSDFDCNDFVYLDPPYLNSLANYNDGKRGFDDWNNETENNMISILENLDNNDVRFALSNNLTVNPNIGIIAKEKGWRIIYLDADYSNSNYQKKDKKAKDIEVLIVNY